MTTARNYDNAQSSQWVAFFRGFPEVIFKLRGFQIPTITSGTTELGGTDFTGLTMPGDHLQYDELQVDFLLDVDYKNYRRLLAWMKYNARNSVPFLTDFTVHLLDNQGNFQNFAFNYLDCFPTLLGAAVPLDTEDKDTDISASVSLKYNDVLAINDEGTEDVFEFKPD